MEDQLWIFDGCKKGVMKIKHWQDETSHDCPRCSGTGEGDWGVFCSVCGGKGETKKEREWYDCEGDERDYFDFNPERGNL